MSNNRISRGGLGFGNGDYEDNHSKYCDGRGIFTWRIGDSRIGELGIDHNTKGLERCYFYLK